MNSRGKISIAVLLLGAATLAAEQVDKRALTRKLWPRQRVEAALGAIRRAVADRIVALQEAQK